jgi:hypothetical protein
LSCGRNEDQRPELVNAINTANGNGEADTLVLASGCAYTLTAVNNTDPDYGPNGLPVITSDITVNGNGSTIVRSSASGTPFRIFQVNSGATLRLNNATVSGGYTDADGGGIHNEGTVNVTNSTFSNNRGTNGGAIADMSGTVDVTDSTFSGNNAPGSAGAIWSFGTLTVANSTFSGNSTSGTGGAILASYTAIVENSTFSGNTAGEGGGIYNIMALDVRNSTFSGNSATEGDGGGIFNFGFMPLEVTNSTFFGNTAFRWGGAIYNVSTLTVTNCTLSGNSATGDADSKGGGIMHDDGGMGAATLNNTIVANSTAGGNCALGTGASAFSDGGGNLRWPSSDTSCIGTLGDPKLSALANNGGPTQTMALQSTSAAIGAGVNANCPLGDQRGMDRPQPTGGKCDSGAYERGSAFMLTITGGNSQTAPIYTAFAQPLQVRVDDSVGGPLEGVSVTFTPPASGASAPITGSPATTNVSGIASVNATANGIAGGPYQVTATSGAAPYVPFNLTNLQADTTTTIISHAPNPSAVGQAVAVSFTVTVNAPSSGTPTGDVTVSDGTDSCTGTVAAGSCNLTFTSVGDKTFNATYMGDNNYWPSSSTSVNHTVTKANTTITLMSSTNPSVSGQSITLTAIVSALRGLAPTPAEGSNASNTATRVAQTTNTTFRLYLPIVMRPSPGRGGPTGTITFKEGTTTLGTATLNGGVATLDISTLAVGSHSITAEYSGDGNHNASTSSALPQTVDKATTTTTLASHTPDPSVVGEAVTVNFNVTVNSPGSGTPTGNVMVSDGTVGCTATLPATSCSLTFTSAGVKAFNAMYIGDSNYQSSSSANVSHTVNKANTTTTITSDAPDPSVVGQVVTVNFTVTSAGGTPTGNVTVSDGTVNCIGTVAAGSCNLTFTSVGAKTLMAAYAGDVNFNGSPLASESHTVNKANTTTTITSNTPNPSVVGEAVTVNFSVTVNSPGGGIPTGNVTISDGTVSCTATLPATSCSLIFTSGGTKTLTATYAGDSNYDNSISKGVPQMVENRLFLPLTLRGN